MMKSHSFSLGHKKHVSVTEKFLGSELTENGSGINGGGNLKGNPCREIGFDKSRLVDFAIGVSFLLYNLFVFHSTNIFYCKRGRVKGCLVVL